MLYLFPITVSASIKSVFKISSTHDFRSAQRTEIWCCITVSAIFQGWWKCFIWLNSDQGQMMWKGKEVSTLFWGANITQKSDPKQKEAKLTKQCFCTMIALVHTCSSDPRPAWEVLMGCFWTSTLLPWCCT